MKKVTFAFIGLGNRGQVHSQQVLKYSDRMEVVAIADPRKTCRDFCNGYLHLPEDRIFESGEELLKQEKLADVMVIATGDRQHKAQAIAALEKGYDLLLEKPVAVTPEDCKEISDTALRFGRKVLVCHVLRYAPFYKEIKRLIDSGAVGKIEAIQATEGVGWYHIAHSYVRGNWHKLADSAPMILAKSCHDLDLMVWLTGKKCRKVTSFGSLDYFTKENCPPDAPARCMDGCKHDECPFHALRYYLSTIPKWPSRVLHPEPTVENITEVLRTSDYGRCVFQMDNDVVDHQIVNLLFEDNITVSFQMIGFTAKQDRTIRVMGTEGEIWGNLHDNAVHVQRFGGEEQIIDLTQSNTDFSGHAGGDTRLMDDMLHYEAGDDFDRISLTPIDRSVESHFIAFAAEKSRLNGGEVVDLPQFIQSIG